MDTKKTKHLVIIGKIILDSPLHIGSGDATGRGTEAIARDHDGNPLIHGSTMAGIVLSHAGRLVSREMKQWENLFPMITGRFSSKPDDEFTASAVNFRTSFLSQKDQFDRPPVHIRHGIRKDSRTGTAAEGAKYSLEIVYPGLSFDLLIEVELFRIKKHKERIRLLALLDAVLRRDFSGKRLGRMGKGSGRGTGWFHLEDVRAAAVDSSGAFRSYLDEPDARAWACKRIEETRVCALEGCRKELDAIKIPEADAKVFDLTIRILEGSETGDWPLLIREAPEVGFLPDAVSDHSFVRIPHWCASGSKTIPVPTIPGGSQRGALRSFFTGQNGINPKIDSKFVNALFPDSQGSRLRISDAVADQTLFAESENLVERVALDEFTRGVIAGKKFNEMPCFSGEFKGRIILEESTNDEAGLFMELINHWGSKDNPWIPLGAHAMPVEWNLKEVTA